MLGEPKEEQAAHHTHQYPSHTANLYDEEAQAVTRKINTVLNKIHSLPENMTYSTAGSAENHFTESHVSLEGVTGKLDMREQDDAKKTLETARVALEQSFRNIGSWMPDALPQAQTIATGVLGAVASEHMRAALMHQFETTVITRDNASEIARHSYDFDARNPLNMQYQKILWEGPDGITATFGASVGDIGTLKLNPTGGFRLDVPFN